MLYQQTIDSLQRLKLFGMAKALSEQQTNSHFREMTFEERLGFLVDRERLDHENRLMAARLRKAKLSQNASFEDIDWRQTRGLDKNLLAGLSTGRWLQEHLNLIIIGPTGVGKSYLACALAQKACREGVWALYQRVNRLFYELNLARGEGRYLRFIKSLAKTDLLVLDDWGLESLCDENRRDMLEILEERHNRKSTIVTSQFPVDKWHEIIGDSTLADAILDRLVHNAHIIQLKGESMRKKMGQRAKTKTES